MCENAMKPEKGLGGPEMRRRRAITVMSKLTVAALRWGSRPLRVLGSCGEASGSLLAPRRGLCDAPVGLGGQQSNGAVVAQGALLCSVRGGLRRLGLWAALAHGMGGRGSAGRFKGRARDPGARDGREPPEITAVISAWPVSTRRERGRKVCRWPRAVSRGSGR